MEFENLDVDESFIDYSNKNKNKNKNKKIKFKILCCLSSLTFLIQITFISFIIYLYIVYKDPVKNVFEKFNNINEKAEGLFKCITKTGLCHINKHINKHLSKHLLEKEISSL